MGFVEYPIEVEEDWPNFAEEFSRVLAVGYNEISLEAFTTGSGTGEPTGLLTALAAASPSVIVSSQTDGAFGHIDLKNAWAALPAKYRARATWMVDVTPLNE